MPKISKQFHLELTVEQFLNACSYLELQELDLLLDGYLKKAQHAAMRNAYRRTTDSEEIESIDAEEVEGIFEPINQMEGIESILDRAINTREIKRDEKLRKIGFDDDF